MASARRIAVLIERPEHVSYRYRWQAFQPLLASYGWVLEPQVLAKGWLARRRQFAQLASADVVVLARRLLPRPQLSVLRRSAKRLVFDFDDAVLFRDSYSSKPHRSLRRRVRFAAVVGAADLVLAGNTALAAHANRVGASCEQVRVMPTVIEPSKFVLSQHRGGDGRRPTQLVWIGSASTAQAFGRARDLFEILGRRFPGLALRVIGDGFPEFQSLPVIARRWSPRFEAAELAAGDIGISWLPDDVWSRGKCGLKVLQYLAAGLPVIANPVGVQTRFVEQSGAGMLAQTADDWVQAVARLAADSGLRRHLGRTGRNYVEGQYSVTAWADVLLDALAGLCPLDASASTGRRSTLSGRPAGSSAKTSRQRQAAELLVE